MSRRIVLELFRDERWRIFGDLHDHDAPGSLTIRPGETLTFGFVFGQPLVFSAETVLATREIQVVGIDHEHGPLARLDEGPYETRISREGSLVPLRLRVEEVP